MKKQLIVALLLSAALVGCTKTDISKLDINSLTDLPALQKATTQVSQEINKGSITMDQAQSIVDKLQQRYVDLTDTADQNIETTFGTIQQIFDTKAVTLYVLPIWAKRLGMTEPKGMELDKSLSQQNYLSGYGSTLLVFRGNYTIALQQAKTIAQKAHLYVSNEFAQAQAIAKIGNIDYISGLDIGGLSKGIIYVNHELLDTRADQFLSVGVDQNGTLTLQATKRKSN
ncbi:MAG: hypothetical protein NTY80_04075 [candidate division SR1 bacterium]|nr:hypothetical protein [candidate division SR1 bacterium]